MVSDSTGRGNLHQPSSFRHREVYARVSCPPTARRRVPHVIGSLTNRLVRVAVGVDVRGAPETPAEPAPSAPRRRFPYLLAGALGAAWLVPLATDARATDRALPLLLRAGRA